MATIQAKIGKNGVWHAGLLDGNDKVSVHGEDIVCNENLYTGSHLASVLNTGSTVTNPSPYSYTIYHNGATAGARISNLGFNGATGPWTFSAIMYASSPITINTDFCDVTASGSTKNITTTPQYVYYTTNAVSSYNTSGNYNGFFDITFAAPSGGATLYISNVKVEKGSVATPWIPAPGELKLGSTMSIDNPVEANKFYEF